MMRLPVLALVLLVPASAFATEPETRPRFCAEDLPEGVRLPGTPPCPAAPTGSRRPTASVISATACPYGSAAGSAPNTA